MVVALALFVINVIGRVIVLLAGWSDPNKMVLTSLYSMLAMALVAGYAGYRWARRYDMSRVVGEVGSALVFGALLATLIGPLLVGLNPFSGGLGIVLRQLGMCFAICAVGGFVGMLLVLALGQDRKSRAWRYQVERSRAKPRRVVKGS